MKTDSPLRFYRRLMLWVFIVAELLLLCLDLFYLLVQGESIASFFADFGIITVLVTALVLFTYTALKRVLLKYEETGEALLRANEELEGYAQTVSHDLKGPLTATTLAASTLERLLEEKGFSTEGSEITELVSILNNNVWKATALIDDLLAMAEAGQTPGELETVDISEVVRSVLEEKEEMIEDRDVQVSMDEDLGVAVMDPTHASQVFSNLVGNAVKHNDSDNPEIRTCRLVEARPGRLRYRVCDNGPGIPEGEMEDIFLPFHKGAGSTGTGIGLSIVDKVVRLYGGEVRAYNDGGACFEFTLPIHS